MQFTIPTDPFLIFGIWHTADIRALTEMEATEIEGGFYDHENRIIVIDKSVAEHLWPEIFMHECTEAHNHLANLKMNHTQISVVSLGMHDLVCNVLSDKPGSYDTDNGSDKEAG